MVVLLKSYDVVGGKKKPSALKRVLKSLLLLPEKEFIHNSRLHGFPLAALELFASSLDGKSQSP